jgi:uncharacterized SAM-binding protein YcdF (DUF218 family)
LFAAFRERLAEKGIQVFLQPFTLTVLLLGIALANLWRKRRETRRRLLLVTCGYLLLFLLSLRVVSYGLVAPLEWQYPPLRQRPYDTQAIVVLSSYVHASDARRVRPELDEYATRRCLVAAELYRTGPACPILVTGYGKDDGVAGPTCSDAMRDLLLQLGVRAGDILVENHSQNTYENAVESRKLLAARGLERIVLVTDANHLPRGVRCFQKQGLDVTPCGSLYRGTYLNGTWEEWVPDVRSVRDCELACHEWLGMVWYWLRGRI